MNQKYLKSMYHGKVNVNSTVRNVAWIKSGIMINVSMNIKIWQNVMCAKKVIFENLLQAVAKMEDMQEVI